MEGDMREIVLQRLEKRLREKDEEIRALKLKLQGPGEEEKELKERVGAIEMEVRTLELTLSEVMKRVGALQSTMDTVLMSMASNSEESPQDEGLSMPGGMAPDPRQYDNFVKGQKNTKEDGHKNSDAARFFHMGDNS